MVSCQRGVFHASLDIDHADQSQTGVKIQNHLNSARSTQSAAQPYRSGDEDIPQF